MLKLAKIREVLKDGEAYFTARLSDVGWLVGYTGSQAYLLIGKNFAHLITDKRYELYSRELLKTVPEIELIIVDNYQKYYAELALKHKKLALSPDLPVSLYEIFTGGGAKARVDKDDIFLAARMVKTPDEAELIRAEYLLAAAAFKKMLEGARFGESESEWAASLEYHMRSLGAKSPSFETIVASGVRGALPHGTASKKIIDRNDAITIDFGSKTLYTSDYTRVVYNGSDADILRVAGVVLEALLTARGKVRPGVSAKELDAAARKVISKAGLARYFTHGLGHGVGVDVHENPYIRKSSDIRIEEGMVFTIEPGVYLEGRFGIRLEDTVLVTADGYELLSAPLNEYMYKL